VSVWAKDLEDGSKAVGLFNLGDSEKDVGATWADLGISGKRAVRDLWRQEDLGRFDGEFQARVAPHGVVLVKISAAGE
jgi:alpha-galactosidase